HRDGVDVDRGRAGETADVAAAVDQHQGAGGAHAAQVEQAQAGGADRAGRVAQGVGGRQLRQGGHQVGDGHRTGGADFLVADAHDRRGRDETDALDARTGDGDRVDVGRRSGRALGAGGSWAPAAPATEKAIAETSAAVSLLRCRPNELGAAIGGSPS
ncbi:hypothetical protein CATMIT_01966, partial [Catenibacterium mitsuokai DSM 15897]